MKLAVTLGIVFLGGLTIGVLVSSPWGAAAPGGEAGASGDEAAAVSGSAESETRGELSDAAAAGDVSPGRVAGGAPASGSAQAAARNTPVVTAAERVIPSVVSVMVTRLIQRRISLLDEFFGRSGTRRVPGLGSGFAIDGEGHILTNNHVVRDADSIVVMDAAGRLYPAELIGTHELTDIALLKVEADRIPPAPLGSSADLVVGEPTVAIGNPSGFYLVNTESTVTSGVVSGVGRDILSEEGREVLYADMVQTDAAINQGNSGGPLVNALGEVIGVNTLIFSRSGGSEGLGFAIPIDRALRVATELSEFGRIRLAWVGVDVTNAASDSLIRLPVVSRVAPDSPGSRAGLEEGDVVLRLNGRPIRNPLDWEVGLLDAGIESTVEVEFRRDDRFRTARLRVEELPSERAERVEVLRGLELVSVTPQIAQERGLEVEFGALIVDIDGPTARISRLRTGDVIVGINRQRVADAEEAGQLFRYFASGDGRVRVTVVRGRGTYTTQFWLQG